MDVDQFTQQVDVRVHLVHGGVEDGDLAPHAGNRVDRVVQSLFFPAPEALNRFSLLLGPGDQVRGDRDWRSDSGSGQPDSRFRYHRFGTSFRHDDLFVVLFVSGGWRVRMLLLLAFAAAAVTNTD